MTNKLLTITELFHYCLYLGKCLKKFLEKSFLGYFDEQKFLSEYQTGFRPNHSSTNKLLCIVHGLNTDFNVDLALVVRGMFLYMLKAFDKVLHEGLIYKLREVRISGETLAHINSFLNNNFQRV